MSDPTQPDPEGASTAVATREGQQALQVVSSILTDDEIGRVWRVAKSLAASGMFKGAENAGLTETQSFAKILIGRDMGLSPAQSLQTLHIVRGNIQVAGKQLLAWVKASDGYDYEVVTRSPEKGAIRFYGKSKRTGEWEALEPVIEFTLDEAKKAGIVKQGGGWMSYPANMCLWRCASIGVNLLCPDLLGGTPAYTEADSFEDRREIGDGEGDGSEPGWQGVSSQQEKALEAMIASAIEKGHAGLSDRATVQMRVAGQTPAFVDQQLQVWAKELAEFEPIPEAEVVPEPEPEEGEQGVLG